MMMMMMIMMMDLKVGYQDSRAQFIRSCSSSEIVQTSIDEDSVVVKRAAWKQPFIVTGILKSCIMYSKNRVGNFTYVALYSHHYDTS